MISLECAALDKIFDNTIASVKDDTTIISELDDIAKVSTIRANKELQNLHRKVGYAVGILEVAKALNYSDHERINTLHELIYDFDLLKAITEVY